ncbi:MAG TPA: transcriptional regulator [Chryseosolibacter sp.]|nr:transcriptional regulator [Chryseosolibacter sp.]
MKKLLTNFNKAFESRVRLGIMSVLMVNDSVDFNTLKELLNLSDGNLASHIRALEEVEYITVNKQFIGRKPNTTYSASKEGRKAFLLHLKELETLIRGQTR